MLKIDYKKQLKHLYNPYKKEVNITDVPKMNFLMIDGEGDPNTSKPFQDAIEALYSVSYALKFIIKKEKGIDYGVLPLEGLWWCDDMSKLNSCNKDEWMWTLMIMQPDMVTPELINNATDQVKKKKNPSALSEIRFENYEEGKAAQIMYIGPFSEEGPTIKRIHTFIQENGYEIIGKHHEIYLSDPRRTIPEKLKTIIRQPIKKLT